MLVESFILLLTWIFFPITIYMFSCILACKLKGWPFLANSRRLWLVHFEKPGLWLPFWLAIITTFAHNDLLFESCFDALQSKTCFSEGNEGLCIPFSRNAVVCWNIERADISSISLLFKFVGRSSRGRRMHLLCIVLLGGTAIIRLVYDQVKQEIHFLVNVL